MSEMWKCPKCNREFTRKNQTHTCGTGDREYVLRNRPDSLVEIYNSIEDFVMSFGTVEVVARDRYILFRSTRIFTDLSIMKDAIRVAIHIGRKVDDPIFIKTVSDNKKVTHVAKLRDLNEVEVIKPLLEEAYNFSLSG